jgi:anti-sigma B factor antagonist
VKADFALASERLSATAHVVDVGGELDLYTSPRLRSHVSALVSGGADTIVVDLSEATFIDSSALHVLLDARRRLHDAGGRFVVVCPTGAIRRVFEVTGVDGLLDIHSSRSSAVAGHPATAVSPV